jgi:hypothetical protein
MDDNQQKIIQAQFDQLPKRARDAIQSFNIRSVTEVIAQKHRLNRDQLLLMENETMLVLLDLEVMQDLAKNIEESLGVSTESAAEITDEIEMQIIAPILERSTQTETLPPLTSSRKDIPAKSFPTALQEAVDSVEITDEIKEIGKKYNLHIDVLGLLVDEVHRVMKGDTQVADFTKLLEKNLGLERKTASSIVEDLNKQVFFPIRAYMKGQPEDSNENVHPLDREELLEEIQTEPITSQKAEPNPQEEPAKPIFTRIHHGSLEKTSDKLEEKIQKKHFGSSVEDSSGPPELERGPQEVRPSGPRPYATDPYREPLDG